MELESEEKFTQGTLGFQLPEARGPGELRETFPRNSRPSQRVRQSSSVGLGQAAGRKKISEGTKSQGRTENKENCLVIQRPGI